MSCTEEYMTSAVHCVAASALGSDQLTCTLFYSPSREICHGEKTKTIVSRRLTKLLRHEAPRRGLPIGSDGYVRIRSILALPEYQQFSVSDVLHVVKCDAKARYSLRMDKPVVLNTGRLKRGNPVNEYITVLSNEENPLLAEEHTSVAKGTLPAVRTNAVCKGEYSRVVRDNVRPVGPPSVACIVDRSAKHQEQTRGNMPNEDALETTAAVCRDAEWVCRPKWRFASPAHSMVTNAMSLPRNRCCKTESRKCCAALSTEKCDDGHTPTDIAVTDRSFTSEQNSVRFCIDGEGSLVSGFVDASQISIRAVQGHSLSSVDSDELLYRVSTVADLVEKSPVRALQKGAGTVSFPGRCKAIPRAPSTSPEASETGISVVHGTYRRSWQSIQTRGLSRMSRNHIHFATRLPEDGEVISGMRPNAEVLIFLNVERALAAGLPLYVSGNGVVLSPGNAQGIIECAFFERVIDRKTGKCLTIPGEEEHDAADGAEQT